LKEKDKVENILKNNKIKRKDLPNFFRKHKEENGCSLCGKKPPHYCLEYHHVTNNNDYNQVGYLIDTGCKIDRILKEMSKCILVCRKCHYKLHNNKDTV